MRTFNSNRFALQRAPVPRLPAVAAFALFASFSTAAEPTIEIWHGDTQRVGHLGDAQNDFNVLGHVESWRDLDTLRYTVNGTQYWTPLSFRAFRRLAVDGDFNADIPIAALKPGENTVAITARFLDGTVRERKLVVRKETGSSPLPCRIEWRKIRDPQDVGQYVDGRWKLESDGLRTVQVAYDRVFLIGDRTWRDYDVRTTITVHSVASETSPHSGTAAVGLILRFAGHVDGGPMHFASGQPKWGYQPFGAIGLLRWKQGPGEPPTKLLFPGEAGKSTEFGPFAFAPERTYAIRMRCETLPDTPAGEGVTRYDFKIWHTTETEPDAWAWQHVQTSRHALRAGGLVLLAHHVDATFGDVFVAGERREKRTTNTVR